MIDDARESTLCLSSETDLSLIGVIKQFNPSGGTHVKQSESCRVERFNPPRTVECRDVVE